MVGAYRDDDAGSSSGSVSSPRPTAAPYAQVAKLTAADGATYDYFGHSVAIDGGTVVAGPTERRRRLLVSSAYVFRTP